VEFSNAKDLGGRGKDLMLFVRSLKGRCHDNQFLGVEIGKIGLGLLSLIHCSGIPKQIELYIAMPISKG